MHYIKVDQIIRMVSQYGTGALMAKFDVEATYRNIAVHPDDRFLLGMKWRGKYFVDLTLPFGLRSVPYIFNSVAEMVEWILLNRHHLSVLLHHLDDFITAGPPNSAQCYHNLLTAQSVCQKLGLPLHPGKCVGPATCLVVLGIELDSLEVCPASRGKIGCCKGANNFVAWSAVVFQGPVGIAYWPSSPRCQSSLAWPHLPSAYDQPPKLFLAPGSPHPSELRIPSGPSMVG